MLRGSQPSRPKITAPSRACSSLSRSAATSCFICATAPKPAMAATFSVPARRRSSCPPPWISGAMASPSRITSAPAPNGPPALWAESVIMSTPRSPKLTGTLPSACTASVCTIWSRASRAISATGWITPVSLLASITLTRARGPSETISRSTGAPDSAMVFASLPPEVNTTMGAITPTARASSARASSRAFRAARPSP